MATEKGVMVSLPLTRGAIAQITDRTLYVATQAFPVVLADSLTGTYKYFDKDQLSKYQVELRKPGASYKKITADVDTKAFSCKNYGLAYVLPEEYSQELGTDMLQVGANYLYDQALQTLEYQVGHNFLKTGVWDSEFAPTVKWSAPTGSNPIADFKQAKKDIRDKGKTVARFALMTEDVYDGLCQNENILDRMAVTEFRAIDDEQKLASILGLQAIYVMRETDLTNFCLVYAKNEAAPKEQPNAGLIIMRNYAKEVKDSNGIGITEPYFDEDNDSDVIKLKLRFTPETPATSLGCLIKTCI